MSTTATRVHDAPSLTDARRAAGVLRRVIEALEQERELVNRALTVQLDGGFVIEEIPSDA